MRFWTKLIPDEPLILDDDVEEVRYLKRVPPAVKGWCLISLAVNGAVAATATTLFRNAGPFLAGMIFALFPSYILLFLERSGFGCRWYEAKGFWTAAACCPA